MTNLSEVTLVTGSADKLAEWQSIFTTLPLQSQAIDIEEIQGEGNLRRIVEYKAHSAYDAIQAPVIVEDVAMQINKFNGMPGPFIKYFLKGMGKAALWDLVGHAESSATAVCTTGFFDGDKLLIATGAAPGTIVAPRGDRGFGFDFTFQPEESNQTYAEMTLDEKNQISHRHRAIVALFEQIQKLD